LRSLGADPSVYNGITAAQAELIHELNQPEPVKAQRFRDPAYFTTKNNLSKIRHDF
jgi:hypothetical protein